MKDPLYDAVIIGSGFGGGLAAHRLVRAGWRVVMLERGGPVRRGPENWGPHGAVYLTPHYSADAGFFVQGRRTTFQPGIECVGGQSIFYGGVSLRMRERDFSPGVHPGAPWPFEYADLEPWYGEAEAILGVAGHSGSAAGDSTAPPRSRQLPGTLPELSPAARLIENAARTLGLRPFRLPLAFNFENGGARRACERCLTCDAFACAVGAKNDIATAVLPALIRAGLQLETGTRATRLRHRNGQVHEVEAVDTGTGRRRRFRTRYVILAAGAIASPALVLASGLASGPGAAAVGRYLNRHCSAIVYGLFPRSPNPEGVFHKQIGIHDLDDSHPELAEGPVGCIQQVHSPPLGLALEHVPRFLRGPVPWLVERTTGLLVLGVDAARFENGVRLHPRHRDQFGIPRPLVVSRYTRRDRAARRALIRTARRVLRTAGARLWYTHPINTFSHAVGTLRMGIDPATSPTDEWARLRGTENVVVADASALPTTGDVNPSLTIAAAALRAADALLRGPS